MKPETHPDYHKVIFVDSASGDEWTSRSTLTSSETREVDGEEIPVISHFLGQSMSHVDHRLFPPKTRGWLRKLGHFFGRRAFVRKVRGRKGVPASEDRLT